MVFRVIDDSGYFIGESETSGIEKNWGDKQLIRPRWNGVDWEEGVTLQELELINKEKGKAMIREKINRARNLIAQVCWEEGNYEGSIRLNKHRANLRNMIAKYKIKLAE